MNDKGVTIGIKRLMAMVNNQSFIFDNAVGEIFTKNMTMKMSVQFLVLECGSSSL